MRLVSGLRDEIDRRRAKYEPETPAAVRRILERIGTPEEVLDTLGGPTRAAAPAVPAIPAVPTQRGPRENVPPHLAGLDELGEAGPPPDWWRIAPGDGAGPQVDGFAGGIEIPELLKRPEEDEDQDEPVAPPPPPPPPGPRLVRFLRERRENRKAAEPAAAAVAVARRRPHTFLLLAAAVLVAGAVSGYWMLLAVGWLVAYASRVLGPSERKWVAFGLPGGIFAGAVAWLWGRSEGRWGEALADDRLAGAFHDLWPGLARGAAVAMAAYLTWRSRR